MNLDRHIEEMRRKSESARRRYALVGSAVFTFMVVLFWVSQFDVEPLTAGMAQVADTGGTHGTEAGVWQNIKSGAAATIDFLKSLIPF